MGILNLFGDVPIGEIFQYKGKTYQVKIKTSNDLCIKCAFKNTPESTCFYLACLPDECKDKKEVEFIEIK